MPTTTVTLESDTDGTLIVVQSDELDEYDHDVGATTLVEEKNTEAQRGLVRKLARAGIAEGEVLANPTGSSPARQDQLRDLAAAIWLEAIYREKAVVLTDDEGFAGKRQYWADKVVELCKDILGEPPQVDTSDTPDRPRGNLRFVPTRV